MQTTDEPQGDPAPPARDAPANDGGVADARRDPSEPASTRGAAEPRPREIGGRDGPEPTRFGDWEKAGRCIDF